MCRFTHQLAAIGTMSWPDSGSQRGPKTVRPNHRGSFWNHPLAETAESEASVGRGLRRSGFAAITKTLINVLFRGRVYMCQQAHVLKRRKMKAQMTSGSGFWKRPGTFGPSRMVHCLFVRARACGPTAWPALLAKAIGVTCFTVVAVGNGIRSTCRKISSATCSWPWKTAVVSRI